MLLLIDIGNTSMKIGMSDGNKLISVYNLPTDFISQSADSLGLRLHALIEHAKLCEKISSCIVSSVVPSMDQLLRHACERFLGVKAVFAHQEVEIPLTNHYESPKEVGADRLVAAYGARKLYPEAMSLICVDYGTATTFDCVSENAYIGGLICPGLMSSLGALATRTAKLPRIALEEGNLGKIPMVGRNTTTSLNHGFIFGFAAMTEGLCKQLSQTLEGDIKVVATGGFASGLAKVTPCIDAVHTDLILDGLRFLYNDIK